MKKLKRNFFTKPTLSVSKNLLGKFVVRRYRGKNICGKIVEVESYIGTKDKASHAYLGKRTKRNEAEYLIGGHIYIYLVYGMYFQFNISTSKKDIPECVLIRALEIEEAEKLERKEQKKIIKLTNGPGKLCKYLKLNKSFYGDDIINSKKIWIEDRGVKIKKNNIILSRRVGIDYAGEYWSKIPWRFYIKENIFVSKA